MTDIKMKTKTKSSKKTFFRPDLHRLIHKTGSKSIATGTNIGMLAK
jgi:hypothetical protein